LINFQIDATAGSSATPGGAETASGGEVVELLRQLLDVQREQLAYQRAVHDLTGRWRAFLGRWQQEFPGLSDTCRQAVPALERSYANLVVELTDRLCGEDGESLESDFALREFLDLYGMRLAQLGTILNLITPLAEAGPAPEGSA
jgi:hypothetical protein